jgi:hypothetical protein
MHARNSTPLTLSERIFPLPFLFFITLNPVFMAAAVLSTLAATALPAAAVLNYNIYETDRGVVIETEGSLDLPQSINGFTIWCVGGALQSNPAAVCTGPQNIYFPAYAITGPLSIAGIASVYPSPDVDGIVPRQ